MCIMSMYIKLCACARVVPSRSYITKLVNGVRSPRGGLLTPWTPSLFSVKLPHLTYLQDISNWYIR